MRCTSKLFSDWSVSGSVNVDRQRRYRSGRVGSASTGARHSLSVGPSYRVRRRGRPGPKGGSGPRRLRERASKRAAIGQQRAAVSRQSVDSRRHG